MKIVDANVLIYAVNRDARHHEESREWLDRALSGADVVGLSWMSLLAFLRLATKRELFAQPLTVSEAAAQVRDWMSAPGAVIATPGGLHATYLLESLETLGVAGNLVNDAHLAALAREQRAEIVSYDNDFDRFTGIRRVEPGNLLT